MHEYAGHCEKRNQQLEVAIDSIVWHDHHCLFGRFFGLSNFSIDASSTAFIGRFYGCLGCPVPLPPVCCCEQQQGQGMWNRLWLPLGIHQRFDLFYFNGNVFHQIDGRPSGLNDHIVFEANTKSFFGDINPGLYRKDHLRFHG